jgi:acetyl esterase/lipase
MAVHWRLKILHYLSELSIGTCGMNGDPKDFNRKRHDLLCETVSSVRRVPARSDKSVLCADAKISDHLSVRVYVPASLDPDEKVPIMYYIHGGGHAILHNDRCNRKLNLTLIANSTILFAASFVILET